MASLELCFQFVQESQVLVQKRTTAEECQVMARSWHRAFVHTDPGDLESAFTTWFDHQNPDKPLFTLPTSGQIQVHLTNLSRARDAIKAGREPDGPKPVIRPEFAVAHLAFRAQVRKLGEAEPKLQHVHPRRADGSTDRSRCGECARIDRVQAAVAELEKTLPAPSAPPRICGGCQDGRGWVATKDRAGVYPCRVCNPERFARWVGKELEPDSGMGRKKSYRKGKAA